MLDKYLSLVVGLVLLGLGSGLIASHIRARRRHLADPTLEERERIFFQRQFRLRMQSSGLLALIGILIPIGDDLFIPWQRHPGGWAAYLMVLLLLVVWLLVLAALDWIATGVHVRTSRNALARLERKQRELQEEVERLRNRQGPDGPTPTHRNGHI